MYEFVQNMSQIYFYRSMVMLDRQDFQMFLPKQNYFLLKSLLVKLIQFRLLDAEPSLLSDSSFFCLNGHMLSLVCCLLLPEFLCQD